MSTETETEIEKTPGDKLKEVISRLKEMEHYSRGNIEKLSADWFLLDDGLKMKDIAKKMEPLMTLQNNFQDAVTELIESAEEVQID